MCNVVALACYNNSVVFRSRFFVYFLSTSCGHISVMHVLQCVTCWYTTRCTCLVRRRVAIMTARRNQLWSLQLLCLLPASGTWWFLLRERNIVGNASGLRCLTVFVLSISAFRSHLKHSGVKCSEQTRLCVDTGGSFKRNLTSHFFKRSVFLSGRVEKLTPHLMLMSLLQQLKAIQCTISCTRVLR